MVLGAIDASITFHFNKRGFKYEASPWLAEPRDSNYKNCSVIHQYKNYY